MEEVKEPAVMSRAVARLAKPRASLKSGCTLRLVPEVAALKRLKPIPRYEVNSLHGSAASVCISTIASRRSLHNWLGQACWTDYL